MWELLAMAWEAFWVVLGVAAALLVCWWAMFATLGVVNALGDRMRRRREAAEPGPAWEPFVTTDPSYITIGVRKLHPHGVEQTQLDRISVHLPDVHDRIRATWRRAQDTAALLNDPLAPALSDAERIVADWTPPVDTV